MTTLTKIDKSSLSKDLATILDTHSSQKLTLSETQNLHIKKERVKLYLQLLETFKKSSSSSENLLIINIGILINDVLDMEKDELNQILRIYFLFISSYIPDFFNTQKLSDKKRHIKKIKKIFIEAIEKIIYSYDEKLTNTLKNI